MTRKPPRLPKSEPKGTGRNRFKSIEGAERRVALLERQIEANGGTIRAMVNDMRVLARLAADGPAFDNPLAIIAAKHIRDRVLADINLNPDGSYKK